MMERSLVNKHSLVECHTNESGFKETTTIDLNHVLEEAGEISFIGREITSGARRVLNFRSVVSVDGQPLDSLYQQLKRRR